MKKRPPGFWGGVSIVVVMLLFLIWFTFLADEYAAFFN